MSWYRGEDAEDLKRSELNELVENLTCLNAFEGKIGKSNQEVVMDEELVQNVVMDEELVQNGVMNETIVKNFVMNSKIDPKVVMDPSMLTNWWMEQFATHQSKIVGRIC